METLRIDFGGIIVGLLVSAIGLISIVISFFRLKRKEYSLLSTGLLFLIYGIRRLDHIPTMATLVGFPFNSGLFDTLLTYLVVIPLAAFYLEIFGNGFYNSIRNGRRFDRLKAFIENHAADSADRTADQLIEHLFKWSGKARAASFEDDLTLIIIDLVTESDMRT